MVTKFDEKWVPKWFQQVIKIEPLGAHVEFLKILRGFLKGCGFDEFLVRQKVGLKSQSLAMLADNF